MSKPTMRRFVLAAIATMATLTAVAQQPMQCLNPDILNGVVFGGRNQDKVEVTLGLPASMSGFKAPAGLTLIGTGVRGGGTSTSIAHKSSLAADKAYAALASAAGAEGWTVEDDPGSRGAFNVGGGPKAGTLCRDGERRGLLAWEVAGTTYTNIVVYPDMPRRECNAPDPGLDFMFNRNATPRFRFPAGTTLATGGGGGGGSNTNFTTSTRIISPETPAQLVELLATQIQEQGWRPDADWSGAASAGSTWRKTLNNQLAWGTLEIVRVSESTYDVDFTVALAQ